MFFHEKYYLEYTPVNTLEDLLHSYPLQQMLIIVSDNYSMIHLSYYQSKSDCQPSFYVTNKE